MKRKDVLMMAAEDVRPGMLMIPDRLLPEIMIPLREQKVPAMVETVRRIADFYLIEYDCDGNGQLVGNVFKPRELIRIYVEKL